jgi:hypothetical protein
MPLRDSLGTKAGPPRSNLASLAAVAVVIMLLAVAPVTLGLAAAFVLIGRFSRWRPAWLILPAVAGLCWTAAAGVGRAVAGYLLVGSRLAQILAAPVPAAARLARLELMAAWWWHGLPGQLPIALIVAAAQARIARRLAAVDQFRPGMIVTARRTWVRAALRRGDIATPDGCCVGLIPRSGTRAAISWQEARGGVLITGHDLAAVSRTGLEVAIAAIQHRKTVIIVDLTDGAAGDPACGEALAAPAIAACARLHAPLAILDVDRGHYDPFSCADPDRAAGLVSAMIDWAGIGQERQLACEGVLRAAFEVIAASQQAPAGSPAAILDEVARWLRPGGLLAVPADAAALAAQIGGLSSTALGARLSRPRPGAGEPIGLVRALADREVALFCLDRHAHGWPAAMIARLVLADLLRVLGDRTASQAPADCLAWINGCEAGDLEQVAALLAAGPDAGAAMVVCTGAGAGAERLARLVNVVGIRGQLPRGSAAHAPSPAIADTAAGELLFSQEDSHEPPAMPPRVQQPDDLTFRVRSPRPRVVAGCRAVR